MDAVTQRESALKAARGLVASAKNIDRLGGLVGPELARWAFEQWSLRASGSRKFVLAPQMLFVREALEQATHENVAGYHASRFPEGELVVDLTCGIGADLLAIASRGPALGLDLDAERVTCAQHNLRVHGRTDSEARVGDALEYLRGHPEAKYFLADPARRVGQRRTLDPADFEPNPVDLSLELRSSTLSALKLSPMMDDRFLEKFGGEIEFISYQRECREALIWLGQTAGSGVCAVHLESGERLPGGNSALPTAPRVGTNLYEVDPAAVRGHCLGAIAAATGLQALGDSNGFLTGDGDVESPWLEAYTVLASGAFDVKALQNDLNRLDAAKPDIKHRGAREAAELCAKKLKGTGRLRTQIALWREGPKVRYAVLDKKILKKT